jgi:hypothetical protein
MSDDPDLALAFSFGPNAQLVSSPAILQAKKASLNMQEQSAPCCQPLAQLDET